MRIEHFTEPFHHTVIHDFFDKAALAAIKAEVAALCDAFGGTCVPDQHHERLLQQNGTSSCCMDTIFESNRNASRIITEVRTLFEMARGGVFATSGNPFLDYIGTSNRDLTYTQLYKKDSYYHFHQDASVLTALYPIHLCDEFSGGELEFVRYGYKPKIGDGACLIFPGFEPHMLSRIESEHDGYIRASINQRLFV